MKGLAESKQNVTGCGSNNEIIDRSDSSTMTMLRTVEYRGNVMKDTVL